MERKILHVDVNNAFLSWSAIDILNNGGNIDIRTIPSAIAGDEDRRCGIILAKSPMAKNCGVITGETIYQAKRKCPTIKFFPSNYKFYHECSDKLYSLLLEYTDKIERFSIDECFLDMTEFLMGRTLYDIAFDINKRVKEELGFTVNIGIANNKLLAKMASDFSKPDKIHTLYKEEIAEKMWILSVSELFMLGKKTVPKLHNMGIKTIGDLAKNDKERITRAFGKHGKLIWEYANGIDEAEVNYLPGSPKAIGNSITLPKDTANINELDKIVFSLVEKVTYRLRREKKVAGTVNVQLRSKDFCDFSHQCKLTVPSDVTTDIYLRAKNLLDEMYKSGTLIRLVGIRVDDLSEKGKGQISLFDNANKDDKKEKIDKIIDNLKDKYGYKCVTYASNLAAHDVIFPSD